MTKQQIFSSLILGTLFSIGSLSMTAMAQNNTVTQPFISIEAVPEEVAGRRIVASDFLSELYQTLDGDLIWNNETHRQSLRGAISNSWKMGLRADDFHSDIVFGNDVSLTPVEEDIIFSDAFARLLYQLQNGKVKPETLDQDWNYQSLLDDPQAVEAVAGYIKRNALGELLEDATPNDDVFRRLSGALEFYQGIADKGGWSKVSTGKALRPGDSHKRIAQINRRLAVSEGFQPMDLEATTYDDALKVAVQAFQYKHGLETDGIIGASTIKAMNVSAEERVDQIRVNLERARWIGKALEDETDMVIVNIASYDLMLIQNGDMSWRTDVIVGKDYRKTPVFTGKMKYTEINPTWTIPPGILRKDILPKFRKDPNYLNKKGYNLYDRSGEKVDSTQIDWASLKGRFPYTIVQPPGEKNALGRIKFIFPNKHSVYLHDTPGRSLFNRSARAFSSGCIRVKDPTKFAEFVLRDNPGWDVEKITQVLDSKKQTRVNLQEPLTTAILYWTVDALSEEGIRFYDDIYGRDKAVLKAINAEFSP